MLDVHLFTFMNRTTKKNRQLKLSANWRKVADRTAFYFSEILETVKVNTKTDTNEVTLKQNQLTPEKINFASRVRCFS